MLCMPAPWSCQIHGKERGNFDSQLAHASASDEGSRLFAFGTGKYDLVPVALHPPHITGMGFRNVDDQKLPTSRLALRLIVTDLVQLLIGLPPRLDVHPDIAPALSLFREGIEPASLWVDFALLMLAPVGKARESAICNCSGLNPKGPGLLL
jgi:hypothetical protein